jgi:hypothetical protein
MQGTPFDAVGRYLDVRGDKLHSCLDIYAGDEASEVRRQVQIDPDQLFVVCLREGTFEVQIA